MVQSVVQSMTPSVLECSRSIEDLDNIWTLTSTKSVVSIERWKPMESESGYKIADIHKYGMRKVWHKSWHKIESKI